VTMGAGLSIGELGVVSSLTVVSVTPCARQRGQELRPVVSH